MRHPIFDDTYPVRLVLELIGDKWTPVILHCLFDGARRFGELQRQVPDISKKMLMQVLRRLERDGLVTRKAFPVVPPRTEYRLTELGRRLHEPVAWMCEWALGNPELLSEVHAHRRSAT